MENKDINNLDPEDIGLRGIFGDRWHDETKSTDAVKITRKAENPAKAVKAPAIEAKTEPNTAKDAQWKPVKPAPGEVDRLKASAKSALLFGGLCLLFFFWQQSGQMETSAALPAMLVCTTIGGLKVGINMKGA